MFYDHFEILSEDRLSKCIGGQAQDICVNLKTLRIFSGMTQSELSRKLSITQVTVSHYESGRRIPDVDTLIQMAELFHTDVTNLIL